MAKKVYPVKKIFQYSTLLGGAYGESASSNPYLFQSNRNGTSDTPPLEEYICGYLANNYYCYILFQCG